MSEGEKGDNILSGGAKQSDFGGGGGQDPAKRLQEIKERLKQIEEEIDIEPYKDEFISLTGEQESIEEKLKRPLSEFGDNNPPRKPDSTVDIAFDTELAAKKLEAGEIDAEQAAAILKNAIRREQDKRRQ